MTVTPEFFDGYPTAKKQKVSDSAGSACSIAEPTSVGMAKKLDFQMGVTFAASFVATYCLQPGIGAEIMRAAGLENMDCSREEETEKEGLRLLNLERGMNLRGL